METFKPPFTLWDIAFGIVTSMLQLAIHLWPFMLMLIAIFVARAWWSNQNPRPSEATLREVGARRPWRR